MSRLRRGFAIMGMLGRIAKDKRAAGCCKALIGHSGGCDPVTVRVDGTRRQDSRLCARLFDLDQTEQAGSGSYRSHARSGGDAIDAATPGATGLTN
jgi:hypothetical protein